MTKLAIMSIYGENLENHKKNQLLTLNGGIQFVQVIFYLFNRKVDSLIP